MKNITLSIPTPCHENWQNMTPTEQGRFCSSCKKEVIDFTKMDDAELYNYLSSLKEKYLCCSASPAQLDRPVFKPKEPVMRLSWYWNYIMLSLLLFTKPSAKAQRVTNEIISVPIKKNTSDLLINNNDSIKNKPFIKSNFNNALPNPVTSIPVTIRMGGAISISKDSAPLYIIDGVIIDNGLSEIDPKSIENIEVLKDAAATAIYGSAAINGVIIVTTKRESLKELRKKIITKLTNTLATFTDSIKVYPNPVRHGNEFNVAIKLKQTGNYSMQVIDLTGKIILQQPINSLDKKIDSQLFCDDKWTVGVYFVRVLNDKEQLIRVSRFVVQ